MAGGGMGGVSSTGMGQPTGQSLSDTPMYDSTNSTSYPPLKAQQHNPFTADAKPIPFLSTPAQPGTATGPNLLSLLAPPGTVTSPNGVQGLFGNDPGFNSQFYLQQNPDVAKSEMYGSNPYQHYLDWGKAEGRVGNFDPNFYLQQNPDVAKAGVDPYQHYLQYGQKEGRAAYNTAAPAVQQQYSQAYIPTTTSWAAPTQQQTFNTPTVSQSGDTGGAVNYQYRRGGIASLLRR